jgi:hypothetical protein
MSYHKAYDKKRECQYTAESLELQYFISNEGNFASHEGASYEAFFEPVIFDGYEAFVEGEAPNSGEIFVWVNLEDYITKVQGHQKVVRVPDMIKFVKAHPLVNIVYVYDLASGADKFTASENKLYFKDAFENEVELDIKDDYVFYVDGLSFKVKGAKE